MRFALVEVTSPLHLYISFQTNVHQPASFLTGGGMAGQMPPPRPIRESFSAPSPFAFQGDGGNADPHALTRAWTKEGGQSPCASTGRVVFFHVEVKVEHDCPTYRPSTRHPRSADSPDSCPRPSTRMGHLRACAADVERRAADSARLAVSGAAQAGEARLDQSPLGNVGEQPAREILRALKERASTA